MYTHTPGQSKPATRLIQTSTIFSDGVCQETPTVLARSVMAIPSLLQPYPQPHPGHAHGDLKVAGEPPQEEVILACRNLEGVMEDLPST